MSHHKARQQHELYENCQLRESVNQISLIKSVVERAHFIVHHTRNLNRTTSQLIFLFVFYQSIAFMVCFYVNIASYCRDCYSRKISVLCSHKGTKIKKLYLFQKVAIDSLFSIFLFIFAQIHASTRSLSHILSDFRRKYMCERRLKTEI